MESQGWARAYPIGDTMADPLSAVELLDHDELRDSRTASDATKRLLRVPRGRRVFLVGDSQRELVAGWKIVKVPRAQITRQIIVASPALIEGLQLHFSPDVIFGFELALNKDGDLVATSRLSESLARHVVRTIVVPNISNERRFIMNTMQELVIARAQSAGNKLDPMVVTIPKAPYAYILAIPGLDRWKRSSVRRCLLVRVLETEADVDTAIGLIAWHAPKGKEDFGFNKICVPTPPDSMVKPVTINPTKSRCNFMSYDTESQTLTVVVSVARFNGSKRVRGAAVRGNPEDGQVFKLGLGWVDGHVRAPSQWALREQFGGAAAGERSGASIY